ncbi:hypothetical protein [Rothia uropygioeca]|uniref:hypothetical protein n=1 Tax=Kocuria sp. 257 TaxID=2021970 RepID=UPI0010125637|nr:hypothetical protein [Kocuria sp. 257]
MTTIIRTQSKISNDLAEYLLPDLGVPVAARWAASTVNPQDPNRIPDAMGLSRTAAVRTKPADARVIESADGHALQITKGSYQSGEYAFLHSRTSTFTMIAVFSCPGQTGPLADFGPCRIQKTATYSLQHDKNLIHVESRDRDVVLIASFDGANSHLTVNGKRSFGDLSAGNRPDLESMFGASYGTITWYEFAILDFALSPEQADEIVNVMRGIYPNLLGR